MLKNKHVIAALIITPILSVLAYFATDALVSEKPHKAVEGQQYPLVAKSNCRYASGQCILENGDVEIKMIPTSSDGMLTLNLISNFALKAAKISLSYDGVNSEPENMQNTDQEGMEWKTVFPDNVNETERLQLAIFIQESIYYAETGVVFFNKDTVYTR